MRLNSFYVYKLLCLANSYLYSFADKVSDLKEKFPNFAEDIQFLADNDPSGNQKYLIYAVKILILKQALKNEISDVIKLFHKNINKLENKDINSYNFTDLRDKLFAISDKKTKRQEKNDIKVSGAVKKYEDDQCVVLLVRDKAAACFYGSGTKWCITMQNRSYFEDYTAEDCIFYFVLRKDLPKENPNYKIAIVFNRSLFNAAMASESDKIQFFDAEDDNINAIDAFGAVLNKTTVTEDALKSWRNIYNMLLKDVKTQPKSLPNKIMSGELSYEEVLENIHLDSVQLALSKLYPGSGGGKKYLTEEVYDKLADSDNDDVIHAISGHSNLPVSAMRKICVYDEETAGNISTDNITITPEIIKIMYNNFGTCQGDIIYNLLAKENCPSEVIINLYNGKDNDECFSDNDFYLLIAKNKNTPKNILDDIIDSADSLPYSREYIDTIKNAIRTNFDKYHS